MSDTQQMKKPDPPGGVEFVVQTVNARFDCSSRGSMSTMTDPYGPNLSPPMISSHSSIPDAVSSQNTNNELLTVGLIINSTNHDPDESCHGDYPDQLDFQFLSRI